MEGNVYNFRFRDAIIGAQMLLVAFGALVLVPLLTGLNSNVALFTAGVGTLLFQIVTRGQIPIFLASSFAFIAPINYGVQTWGLTATLGGMIAVGLFYMFLSFVIKVRGVGFFINLLPPIVTGSVIAVIGLILAPTGMKMAMGIAGTEQVIPQSTALIVSMSSLTATVLVSILGKGILRLLPIIVGIVVGWAYLICPQWRLRSGFLFRISRFRPLNSPLSFILFLLPWHRLLNILATFSPSVPSREKISWKNPA